MSLTLEDGTIELLEEYQLDGHKFSIDFNLLESDIVFKQDDIEKKFETEVELRNFIKEQL